MGSSPRYGRAWGRTSSRAAVRSWVLPGSTSETHSGIPRGAASACTFPAGSCAFPEYHLSISHDLRSEEHTSELQSHLNLVCRLLLEKKEHTPQLQPHFNL